MRMSLGTKNCIIVGLKVIGVKKNGRNIAFQDLVDEKDGEVTPNKLSPLF